MRYAYFSRILALLMMILIILAGCPLDLTLPESGKTIITPGEGTQYYAYLDEHGNISKTDTGKTLHYVDNNKNAEGVFSVADKFREDNRVTIFNSGMNTTFTFLFREGKNFPYKMDIYDGTTTYYGHLTMYREETCTYDIVFQQNGVVEVMRDLVLNKQFLDVYSGTSESDIRLSNITVAAGLLGSLAVSLGIEDLHFDRSLKKLLSGVKNVLSTIAVVSYAAAFIAVPIGLFVSPVIGGIILAAAAVNVVAVQIIVPKLEDKIAALEKEEKRKEPIKIKTENPEDPYVYVLVSVIYQANGIGERREFKNGEEFHIGLDESVTLEFTILGSKKEEIIPLLEEIERELKFYDPDADILVYNYANNIYFKKYFDIGQREDQFQIKFSRPYIHGGNYTGLGKISFGIKLPIDNEISINEKKEGIYFQSSNPDDELSLRKDMVVIKFCIDPKCEDNI